MKKGGAMLLTLDGDIDMTTIQEHPLDNGRNELGDGKKGMGH